MPSLKPPDSIDFPLFSFLQDLHFSKLVPGKRLELNAFFWSLVRAFGVYHRIITAYENYEKSTNDNLRIPFLEEDIENFIIRARVVLNDLAFIIRQIYPKEVRGLKGPKGPVHPLKKEVSFRDLCDFTKANPTFHPSMGGAIRNNLSWLSSLIETRNNILHYKSKALVFYHEDRRLRFCMVNPANDEPMTQEADGKTRLVTKDVFEFTNHTMLSLFSFLNQDVLPALTDWADSHELRHKTQLGDSYMSAPGTETFMRVNGL